MNALATSLLEAGDERPPLVAHLTYESASFVEDEYPHPHSREYPSGLLGPVHHVTIEDPEILGDITVAVPTPAPGRPYTMMVGDDDEHYLLVVHPDDGVDPYDIVADARAVGEGRAEARAGAAVRVARAHYRTHGPFDVDELLAASRSDGDFRSEGWCTEDHQHSMVDQRVRQALREAGFLRKVINGTEIFYLRHGRD